MNGFYEALYRYISPIFGYVMLFFYNIVGSYGVAIILFTIFARLITMPTTLSQQKGMAKQQRLAPKIRRIQERYAGDQQKIQQETQNLYAREGYNPMSAGCLPLLIQMPFIIGLFGVLYNPLRYAIGLDADVSNEFVDIFTKMVNEGVIKDNISVKSSSRYFPMYVIHYFDRFQEYIAAKGITFKSITASDISRVLEFYNDRSFYFFGLELGHVPSTKSFDRYWSIPILSGLTSLASAFITQAQQKKANPSANAPGMGCTMLLMPAMSIWFTFMFPCGIGVYWITSSVFAVVQSFVMKKIYSPQKNIAKLMIAESVERRSREDSVKRIHK